MHTKYFLVSLCSLALVALYECAPLDNEIPARQQNYTTLKNKYKEYIRCPPPSEVMLPTKNMAEEQLGRNVIKVEPAGVLLRRCPDDLPEFTGRNEKCRQDREEPLSLEVFIKDIGEDPIFRYWINARQHVTCICMTE